MSTATFRADSRPLHDLYTLVIFSITVAVVLCVTIFVNLLAGIDIVYTHLFYIPIILAAIFYHRKAVLLALFLGALHVSVNYHVYGYVAYDSLLRAVMFLVIAYFIGMIVEKKDRLCDVLKSSEEQLRRMHETLERRIGERTTELNAANEGLRKEVAERRKAEEALLESKAQAELYVDIMGHDINNMNQAIMGYLEMASELMDDGHPEKEFVARPIELVKNGSRLIDNVKKLQRINAGEISSQEVDLGEMLSQLVSKWRLPGNREIAINYAPVAGCKVMAPDLMSDAFGNIIDNAVKHSRGPLMLNIRLDQVNTGEGEYYRVAIEDNGPGIPDDMKEKLCRDIAGNDIKAERRGLGLYLVKTLVDRSGGRMRVEDRVAGDYRKGSRFVVMLPVA